MKMEKNPVSLLQETMIKYGSIPIYELISSVEGTHQNTFTIQVRCNGNVVNGIGTSKKQAKQKAAEEMLKLLTKTKAIPENISTSAMKQIHNSPDKNVKLPELTPGTTVSEINGTTEPIFSPEKKSSNYIGRVNEFCAINKIADPVYLLESVSGPSHRPEFTMSCTVASITEVARGPSKQSAKHAVAEKVFKRLQNNQNYSINMDTMEEGMTHPTDQLSIEYMNLTVNEPEVSENSKMDMIISRYKQLKGRSGTLTKKEVPVKEYHIALKRLCCDTHLLEKFMELYQREHSLNMNHIEDIISNAWKIKLERITFSQNKNMEYIIGFRLNVTPTILEIGTGSTEKQAEVAALHKLFELFLILTK